MKNISKSIHESSSIHRSGYSLIEVAVCIGVIGILFSLLLSAVENARSSASRTRCLNNLKQVSMAIHNYEAAHETLPPKRSKKRRSPERLLSWHANILPYIEKESLWRTSVAACEISDKPFKNPPHVGYATPVYEFICPDDSRLLASITTPSGDVAAFSSFVGVSGSVAPGGFLPGAFAAVSWFSVNWKKGVVELDTNLDWANSV